MDELPQESEPKASSRRVMLGVGIPAAIVVFAVGRYAAAAGLIQCVVVLFLGGALVAVAVRRIRHDAVRTAAAVAGTVILVSGLAGRMAVESHVMGCDEAVQQLQSEKGKHLSYDETIAEFTRLEAVADDGFAKCVAAGEQKKADSLTAARAEIDRQKAIALGRGANPVAATSVPQPAGGAPQPTRPSSADSPLASNCPKGQMMVDTKRGTMVPCTGGAPPQWVSTFAKIIGNPKGAHPTHVDKSVPAEVDYSYEVPPFSDVELAVYDGIPARWALTMKGTVNYLRQFSTAGGPTPLCTKGLATWYAFATGDGPLGGAFVAADTTADNDATINLAVSSGDHMAHEKKKDEADGVPRTSSIEASVCQ